MKRKVLVLTTLLLVSALILTIVFNSDRIISQVFSNSLETRYTVIIDAGHGGFDGGAVASDGTSEKNINLEIAKNLRDFLLCFGFDVIMTRESDKSTESDNGKKSRKSSDLYNRANIMNENPDAIFVSIHLNKFTTSSVRGAQVFYSPKAETSDILAQSIQTSIKNLLQPENSRVIKQGAKSIYLLNNATVPAAIVECGFISNYEELSNLKEQNYQRMMAFSIFCGIIEYYNGIGQ